MRTRYVSARHMYDICSVTSYEVYSRYEEGGQGEELYNYMDSDGRWGCNCLML